MEILNGYEVSRRFIGYLLHDELAALSELYRSDVYLPNPKDHRNFKRIINDIKKENEKRLMGLVVSDFDIGTCASYLSESIRDVTDLCHFLEDKISFEREWGTLTSEEFYTILEEKGKRLRDVPRKLQSHLNNHSKLCERYLVEHMEPSYLKAIELSGGNVWNIFESLPDVYPSPIKKIAEQFSQRMEKLSELYKLFGVVEPKETQLFTDEEMEEEIIGIIRKLNGGNYQEIYEAGILKVYITPRKMVRILSGIKNPQIIRVWDKEKRRFIYHFLPKDGSVTESLKKFKYAIQDEAVFTLEEIERLEKYGFIKKTNNLIVLTESGMDYMHNNELLNIYSHKVWDIEIKNPSETILKELKRVENILRENEEKNVRLSTSRKRLETIVESVRKCLMFSKYLENYAISKRMESLELKLRDYLFLLNDIRDLPKKRVGGKYRNIIRAFERDVMEDVLKCQSVII